MNVTKKLRTDESNNGEIMVLIPLSLLNTIDRKQDELLKLLKSENLNAPALKEYLSEEEARAMLKKGKQLKYIKYLVLDYLKEFITNVLFMN